MSNRKNGFLIMRTIVFPTKEELNAALQRPALEAVNLDELMNEIFSEVEKNGDAALRKFAAKFDNVELENIRVDQKEIDSAENLLSQELKLSIRTAAANIERFHKSQVINEREVETTNGVICWRKSVGIRNVGLYIPGGTAPLFSTVLMLGIPAKIAGCENRILCTPPSKDGSVNPAILYAAKVSGITEIFKIGGAQAIAGMAVGTESMPKVDKLFGPGNQYVTAAKLFAQKRGIAIDMPAGPSEVLVTADDSIPAAFVAADLLAQAEHGADSQVVFVTDSKAFVSKVKVEVEKQLKILPRAEIASKALENSVAIVEKPENWPAIINKYAPEHLIVMGKYEEAIVREVVNAGSIFIGKYTAESFGDYASGTNHTLPTNGFARSYSGVSVDSFVKKITYQKVSEEGLQNLGPTVIAMAGAEGLQGHANAVKVRLDSARQTYISMSNNERFIRPDLRDVKPYSSARDEFGGKGEVFLDANENGLLTAYNRYPDPVQKELKKAISKVKGIPEENLFLGNGSDEVLDLVLRLTSTPFIDSVAYLNPSYGMYTVLAKINGLETVEIALDRKFGISAAEIIRQAEGAKVLILCNPNNPTGAVLKKDALLEIVENFKGVVVVDEAYIDFCPEYSLAGKVNDYENLIVVQTLSKAYGMAGLRIGIAIASENWVKALNSIKPPYNLSSLVQETAIQQLESTDWPEVTSTLRNEKEKVVKALESMEKVEEVFPSKANFVLFRIGNAGEVYQKLLSNGVVVRDRSTNYNCENTLRISIGNEKENDRFIEIMKEL